VALVRSAQARHLVESEGTVVPVRSAQARHLVELEGTVVRSAQVRHLAELYRECWCQWQWDVWGLVQLGRPCPSQLPAHRVGVPLSLPSSTCDLSFHYLRWSCA